MKRSSRNEKKPRICVPIVETTMEKALKAIKAANPVADLIELRVDYLKDFRLAPLIENGKPIIVTNRRREEGGRFGGNEQKRFRALKEAAASGAKYVDVELRSNRAWVHDLIENRNGTKIILSFHDFRGTPSPKELRGIFNRMIRLRADVIKIATYARSLEDNLTALSLIPYARERSQQIVAFCMGEKGKMSRVFSPMMGAAWTYASLSSHRTSAPGQLTVGEMNEIWKKLLPRGEGR